MTEVKTDVSCLILVKNEAYFLPYVLRQTEGFFDSYVIYDVGSTDGTVDIIEWFRERNEGKVDMFIRYLPHVPPEVQGAFRNSMILEGNRPTYFLLDGDELYRPDMFPKIIEAASWLRACHMREPINRYGMVRRIEVSPDLSQRYVRERTHHRIYTNDAWWTGTHPGEAPFYKQDRKSEIDFPDIKTFHMHNTLRSPKEDEALRRRTRKLKKTYHPNEQGMTGLNLIQELPMLAQPIENFPVSPALAKLQASVQQHT